MFLYRLTGLIYPLVFLLQLVCAQKIVDQSSDKPGWILEPPKGKYYFYYTGVGSSPISLSDAKEQAIASLLSEIILEGKITANSSISTFHEQSNQGIISEITREVQQIGESTVIEGLKKEEEYWQTVKVQSGILYQYWILMKVSKPEFTGFNIDADQGYGFKPVLKSALIPGWGQYHKGESGKAVRFLISETVLVSSSLISYYLSNNFSTKASNERDYDKRKFYNNWSNRSYTIGTVAGVLAGGIYCYNLFDVITSKGAKRYADSNLNLLPIYTTLNQNQVSLKITFNL